VNTRHTQTISWGLSTSIDGINIRNCDPLHNYVTLGLYIFPKVQLNIRLNSANIRAF